MKPKSKLSWRIMFAVTVISAVVIMFATSSRSLAQDWNQTYTVGESIEVQWADQWLAAKIIEEKDGWYTIRYAVDGMTNRVQKNRMRPLPGARPQPKQPAEKGDTNNTGGAFKVGDKVEVDSRGSWLPAEVLAVKGNAYRVHYDGYSQSSDEWISLPRIRLAGEPAPEKTAPGKAVQTEADALNDAERGVNKYKPGDRIECDPNSMGGFEKGTVIPRKKTDPLDGKTFRVRLDTYARVGQSLEGDLCYEVNMRPLGGPAYKHPVAAIPVGKTTVDAENTVSADRAIMECPVKQTPVKNGAANNPELFKKLIRCYKGEKTARRGADGAVAVEVSTLQAGATRPWIYGRDFGGKPSTIVHPVKVTFHYKTFFRSGVEVSQNWISTINFFVNSVGEWDIASEETAKMGERVNVPREQ